MSVSFTAMTSGSRISRQHSLEELFHFALDHCLGSVSILSKGNDSPSDKKTPITMNWFGSDFLKLPEDVCLIDIRSPLSLSLTASEEELRFISNLRGHAPAQAVVKQPTPGARGRTTITAVVQTGGDWSTGLFSVCRDRRICFCGLFCPICLECDIARQYGECFCWPLLPGSTFALRVGTRERHKIWGTLCEDWLAVHCCWPFSICQLARELKTRARRLYEISAAPSVNNTFI